MSSRLPLICALFFTLLLQSCASVDTVSGQSGNTDWYVNSEDKGTPGSIIKSPADDRNYRYLTLDNGLDVLLISDSDTDKAAASLSIDVGSFQNPPEREGLAHFLEHMLFLGTDKYPEAGEYQAYLSEHGGSFNAYTSLEETNYFFDVDSDYLLPTLDRFSRFFVAPLFNAEYVDRERHAVDSEYKLKIKDDSRREWDVWRELANPAHPFSLFSVGSLETLNNPPDNPVREDLVAFYKHYYTASRMNLVVLGSQPLDKLQQEVVSRFSPVPAHSLDLDKQDIPLFAESLPLKLYIRPEKELRQLSFNFPVPSVADHWRTKPLQYLGHLLGHEGKGSLIADLKSRGLAESLQAGLVYDSRHGALFSVQINLTPQGVDSEGRVTKDFFRWLDLVKSKGVEKWRYDEVARLAEIDFRFSEEVSPMGYVQRLSGDMHQFSPESVLLGNYSYQSFSPTLIRRYANYLGPENVVIELMAPGVETDRNTQLYGTPYRVESLDVADFNVLAGEGVDTFSLPRPNPYVPEVLAVRTAAPEISKPFLVQGQHRLWFFPDNAFNSPKGYFQARIALPDIDTIEERVLLDFLVAGINDQLASETYPAMLAGLNFNISPWEEGVVLTLSGYNEKQQLMLQRIIEAIETPDWSWERLERVRNTLIRGWRNTASDWPLRQLFGRLSPLLTDNWMPLEKAAVLDKLEVEQLQAFHRQLLNGGKGRFYAAGNYTVPEAEKMAASVVDALGLSGTFDTNTRIRNLARSEVLPVSYHYVDHDDSATVLYLQGDRTSLDERAAVMLLSNIVSAPFYNTLRTEKQLGYAVGSSIMPLDRVPGILFYVQSPKMKAAGLRSEINNFLTSFEEQMMVLTGEDMERYRQSVLAQIEEKPRNLNELAQRHLESLDLAYDEFDFRERLADAVRKLKREDVINAYRRLVVGERPGLWVLSSGDANTDTSDTEIKAATEGFFAFPD